jgi:hypothetical protein
MKKKSQPPPPDPPFPECIGCEHYWFSGRFGSLVFLDDIDGLGREIETRIKCKMNTHYCRHPKAKLYEILPGSRWFCVSPKRE